jgi:Ca2+-binding RTX toxin-like protein
LSFSATDNRLDLNAESFSNIEGKTGNMAVARGTVIENATMGAGSDTVIGNAAANLIDGGMGNDSLRGGAGADRLRGESGNDTLEGGAGADILSGGDGDDFIFGGDTASDRRDLIYGGEGNDYLDGSYGNDELHGGNGSDTVLGGHGADTVIGNAGDDILTGSAYSDLIFGNDGFDFINGGFGSDRLNGGAGGDRFFHVGVAGHGSDWIQDFSATEGDVLQYGGAADPSQFQVNFANTVNAGDANFEEAFVIYRPTGQILWALVDGAAQDSIDILIGGEQYDLLA